MNVEKFLKDQAVPFEMLSHRPAYTASRTAESLHVPGANFAKSVVLKVNDRPVLAVLPASRSVNMPNAEKALGADHIVLADEEEMATLFPDCELGAVPPFGSQYGLETIVDDQLTEDEHIVFDGNTHDRAVYMRYSDFEKLEHPRIAQLTSGVSETRGAL
jgi:Ala-tRNA(Pro) deacylase